MCIRDSRYTYKLNVAMTISELKRTVVEMLSTSSRLKRERLYAHMVVRLSKAVVPVRPDRSSCLLYTSCRLDVTFPEIAKMQTAAIIKAALAVRSRRPAWKITPEIMVPLVGEEKELAFVKSVIDKTAKKIIKEAGSDMTYKVGTMIEIPRAALTADAIANEAEFFSFGTNDLTQMTFGFSRDDAGKFLASYYDRKIYESDPFSKLDQAGVGRLVKMAAELGRQTRPDIKLGICGEQGGDPSTVEFRCV